MGISTGAALLIGAVGGGIAGAIPKKSRTTSESTSGISLAPESSLERLAGQNIESLFSELETFVQTGAGQEDIARALDAQRSFAARLGEFGQGGFLPGAEEFRLGRQFAEEAFAPEQVALEQSFEEQATRVGRQAALRGRPTDDPILQAKLATQQIRAQERFGARRGALATQIARDIPLQQLGFQAQQTQALGGLATQALQNRQLLLNLGQQIQGSERQFRLATGTRFGTQRGETISGGGVGGAISGALAGAGTAGFLGGTFPKLFTQAGRATGGETVQTQPFSAPTPPQFQQQLVSDPFLGQAGTLGGAGIGAGAGGTQFIGPGSTQLQLQTQQARQQQFPQLNLIGQGSF